MPMNMKQPVTALRNTGAAFCLLFAALTPAALADNRETDPGAAADYVETLGSQVIRTLGKPGGNTAGPAPEHVAALETMLRENLHLTRIIRIMAGSWWREMGTAEQNHFSQLVGDYITLKYALFLAGYRGETFEVTDSQRAGSRDALVVTSLSRNNRPWAQVEWRVTRSMERLYILDVKIEGVSLIRTEQSQIQAVLQQNGVQGLLGGLQAQIGEMRGKAAGG